jgi:hypothetical protein
MDKSKIADIVADLRACPHMVREKLSRGDKFHVVHSMMFGIEAIEILQKELETVYNQNKILNLRINNALAEIPENPKLPIVWTIKRILEGKV